MIVKCQYSVRLCKMGPWDSGDSGHGEVKLGGMGMESFADPVGRFSCSSS